MVAAKSDNKTELVADGAPVQMVRMRANREVADHTGHVRKQGEEFETTEEWAKQIEKPITGHYNFFGTRSSHDAPKMKYVRAVRI